MVRSGSFPVDTLHRIHPYHQTICAITHRRLIRSNNTLSLKTTHEIKSKHPDIPNLPPRTRLQDDSGQPFHFHHLSSPLIASSFFILAPATAAEESSKLTVVPLQTRAPTGDSVVCLCHRRVFPWWWKCTTRCPECYASTEKALKDTTHQYMSVSRGEDFFTATTSNQTN